jgi:hypothetical protein
VFTQGSPSNAALFVCQNQRCHDHRYANTPSIAISKSLSQTKSLHAHAITVKLTKSIAERLLRQNSVQNPNDTPGLVQQELCFGSAKHEFFIRYPPSPRISYPPQSMLPGHISPNFRQ